MNTRLIQVAALLFFLLFGGSWILASAQEVHVEAEDFGASQVFSTFFQAQRISDLVLFLNGGVASATITNETFEVLTGEGETLSFTRDEISAMRFNINDEGIVTRLFIINSDPVDGTLLTELQIDYAIGENADVALDQLNAIVLKVVPVRVEQTQTSPSGEEQTIVTEQIQLDFSYIFPIMTRMFASMSKFDTAILPDNQLASIELANRDELQITIDSANFGLFTFPAEEVASIEFAQEEDDRDVLILQDGDRVSGQIIVEGELQGSLAMGDGEFGFNQEELRENFKQLVFQLPTDLFGGGGAGGHGVIITEDN